MLVARLAMLDADARRRSFAAEISLFGEEAHVEIAIGDGVFGLLTDTCRNAGRLQ